jgi:hypothetical protein
MGQPTVTPLVEVRHDGGFIVSLDNTTGHRCFDQITLTATKGLAGMVLGLIATGATAASVAFPGNTGNGVFGAVTTNTLATQIGVYQLLYTDATHFTVTAPDGSTATGVNGTPFSALGIGFTMTSGGTPMVAGDGFAITTTARVGNPTAASVANAGNTGNSTSSAVTVTGYAPSLGDYKVVFTQPNTNLGTFDVEDPSGKIIGTGNVGTAFKGGGLSFTIADGSSDFVAGDGFVVTVAAGSGKYRQWDPANVDGSQTAAGILYQNIDATVADKMATLLARASEVNLSELIWPTGANAATIAAGNAQLKAIGILCR